MKLGIALKIDVTKIDKARIFEGKKGKYLDLTTFIDTDEQDEYGNNGFISHSQTKEERQSKTNTPIVGNAKVFYGATGTKPHSKPGENVPAEEYESGGFDDDIPF